MTRGGKREGAGRKPSSQKKVMISKRVDPTIAAYLTSTENATETIENAIKGTAKFKAWKKLHDTKP